MQGRPHRAAGADLRQGRFPAGIVHAPEFNGDDGVALWTVWSEKDSRENRSRPSRGQIVARR